MKQTIRTNTFETNSSSLHTLTVSKMDANPESLNDLDFNVYFGSFGWEKESYTNPVAIVQYLWTLVHYAGVNNKYMKLMKEWLPNCNFIEPESLRIEHDNDGEFYDMDYADGYIDHAHDWLDSVYNCYTNKTIGSAPIDEIFSSKEMFANLVLNGRLATWNDNDDTNADPEFLEPKNAVEVFYKGN